MRAPALYLIVLMGHAGLTLAHGNVHERIHDLDHEIVHHPKNPDLLIKRGRLYLDEGHAEQALEDFIEARKFAPERVDALYHLAEAQLMLKRPEAALQSINGFVKKVSNDAAKARGFALIGEIHSQSGKPLAAAEAYIEAIKLSREPKPDHVLYAADAFHAGGETAKAIAVLDDGMMRLGPLQALSDRALVLEMEQRNYDAALRRIDSMLAGQQRVPFLLYKKGLILKALARNDESRQAFVAALKEIDDLPRSRQQVRALKDLRALLLAETS